MVQVLVYMPRPSSAKELPQFICAINWMRESLLDFASVISPLQELLKEITKEFTSRSNKLKNVQLDSRWGATHDDAFRQCKDLLQKAVQLAHPKEGYRLCVFTDASNLHWGL